MTWPGVSALPDYKPTFPSWKAKNLADIVKYAPDRPLEPAALDLMSLMMRYTPGERITAKAALHHPYFADLDKSGMDY